MAAAIGRAAANKLLKKQAGKYVGKSVSGDEDPYFMMVKDPRTGKTKKVHKQVPAYIPDHDAVILAKMRKRAYKLDMALFTIAGIRFGWSSVIGLIPLLGDVGDALLAILLVMQCRKIECGLDMNTFIMMMINVAIDAGIGLVPIVGDIFDGAYKANTRNVRLLEKRLDAVYKTGTNRKDNHIEWNGKVRPPPPATAWDDFDDEDKERRDFVREQQEQERAGVQRPQPAATRADNNNAGGRGRWFSPSRGSAGREPDVEMAQTVPIQPVRPTGAYDDGQQETGTVLNGRR